MVKLQSGSTIFMRTPLALTALVIKRGLKRCKQKKKKELCLSTQLLNGSIWQKQTTLGQRSMMDFVAVSLDVRCYVVGEERG